MPLTPEQKAEIDRLRAQAAPTRRATVPGLEEILYEPIPVLDHGFVRVIDYMGDDAAVVQAARVSYGKGTKKVSEDRGLIHYLMRHRHTTPFEMCEIKYHVKLPIFVARQWIRHRTANVNEYSARYSILDNEFYIPAPEQLAAQSKSNRQGRGDVLVGKEAQRVLALLREDAEKAYRGYVEMLNADEAGAVIDPERQGLARELARMNLSLNFYTQWYWKTDLYNLLNFLSLRGDAHAQYEIRVYAEAMIGTLERWVPMTAEAFRQYRLGGAHLSERGLAVVKRLIAGDKVTQEESGMSKREWTELGEVLGREEGSGDAASSPAQPRKNRRALSHVVGEPQRQVREHLQTGRFYVYLNIDPLPAAWAAYRGTMCSASSIGTATFRPVAYWPCGLLKRAAAGDQNSLLRLEKELAAERVRREHYPNQVSRLHGIYLWASEQDAIRCESKWRANEGQHFDRDRLVEVGFSYTDLTRVDTQWIDQFVLNNDVPLDRNDLTWAHQYWNGEPWDADPHWEILVEGRGLLWGTELRTKALQRVGANWPHLLGQLELSRLAADMGCDLYTIAPFVFQDKADAARVEFCIDARDQNDDFMRKAGEHINTLDKSSVNWKALELLRSDQLLPDLRQEGFEFHLNVLTPEAREIFPFIVSQRDTITWSGPTSTITPTG